MMHALLLTFWFVQLPPEPLIPHFDGDGDDDL
jgi:hypothetical protein